jgi:hypothetical protein
MVPFHEVFTGSRCNQHCQDCPAAAVGVGSHTRQEILAVLDSARPPREGVSLYGGEPLLRSDLLELIQTCRQRGFPRIRVRTNGTLLADGDLLQQLLAAGCHHFEIKLLAADPRVHDEMTARAGSLQQTWTAMERLRQVVLPGSDGEHPFLGIRLPLRSGNTEELSATILGLMPVRPDRVTLCWQIARHPYAQFLSLIHNAINLCLLNRTWILTEGLPLCQMAGFEAHVAEIYTHAPEAGEQVAQCRHCIHADVCPGIPIPYLRAQGSGDIRPVRESPHAEDIRNLVNGRPGKPQGSGPDQ